MRVAALLTVRNEELYLARCLEHLMSQGIETCLIDNDSTDRTLEIARKFLGRGVFRIEHLPFRGYFDLQNCLQNNERLANEINADWFILHDADEIRQAPNPYKTLLEGIEDVDSQGYNAINFDEFLFLPTSMDESFENRDYVKEMKYYYFLEPRPLRHVKAWKKSNNPIDLTKSAGHKVNFEGIKIFPIPFILRHYIGLSRQYLEAKYGKRIYSPEEVARGWHKGRVRFKPELLKLPNTERLKKISDNNIWDKSDPWKKHEFLPKKN